MHLYRGNEPWGDTLLPKMENHLRISFWNVNSLPTFPSHPKNREFIQDIDEAEYDIMGVSEVNVNWQSLPFHDKPYERFCESFESQKMVWAQNEVMPGQDIYQPGGTFMIANSPVCYHVIASGKDPRKLGRWSWMLLQGK